ncbi:MAG: hypothetical protein M3Y82_07770 [Verrucomicrobiota bacterium]|nr:hypothetical protein [Verrucomicrobiota bacterium]
MNDNRSEYYPPRAGWRSPFRTGSVRLVAFFQYALSPLKFRFDFGWRAFALSILLPGYAIRHYGFQAIGNLIISIYFTCVAIFLVWLGYTAASFSFSIMLSLHVSSICFLLSHLNLDSTLQARIASSLAVLIGVSFLIYLPARHVIEKFAQPLRTHNRVIVVNPMASPKKLKRGNWVAYSVSGTQSSFNNSQAHGTVILQDGFGLGKIAALPGDNVRFFTTNFLVNGVSFPRGARMPADGELVVPEKHWFIWPDLAMNMQGAAAEIQIQEILRNRSLVGQSNFVGAPYKHWFFRSQTL